MSTQKNFLKETLTKESRAYGFTIAFWGSGAVLINQTGLPNLFQALLYGLGAVTGFGLLTLYAYRSALKPANIEEKSELMILGMVHYIAALVPMAAAAYTAKIGQPANFFLTGISATVLYNLGMVVEQRLTEQGAAFEKKMIES